MAYLWFDGADKTRPWRTRLDDGAEYLSRAVFSLDRAATVTDGRSRGLAVDHVLRFDEGTAQMIDAVAAPTKTPGARKKRR